MRVFATLHRWWGVAFCLLFAIWFASGLVMHFVPFPARSERSALREIDVSRTNAVRIDHDQWTVSGDFDRDRPLTRIALNDDKRTEIYISASGRLVLATTGAQRLANYAGSVAHWFYATELRHHKRIWKILMWWLSLLATIGAALGVIIGSVRLGKGTAYRGLHRWHHLCGLIFSPFLLGWIFSGFLSMDDGWLFAHGDKLFRALHRLDFPPLSSHPWLRTSAIVTLCLCGLVFSLTGVVLAWRRIRESAARTGWVANS
jgi:hypothetical protein